MVLHPALVAAVLGRVDRRHQRRLEAPREVIAGVRDQPVVPVDEVEVEAVAELDPGGQHVGVHPLDPGDELAEVGGEGWARGSGGRRPRPRFLGGRLLAAAGEDVDLDPELDQRLGELADVARQAALDQRRVLPGEDQDAGHGRRLRGSSRLQERCERHVRGERTHTRIGVTVASYGLVERLGVIGGPLPGVVARLPAAVEEGPVAGLGGEQLARGALRPRPAETGARPPAAGAAPAAAPPRRGRRPAASPRSRSPCPRPSWRGAAAAARARGLRAPAGR